MLKAFRPLIMCGNMRIASLLWHGVHSFTRSAQFYTNFQVLKCTFNVRWPGLALASNWLDVENGPTNFRKLKHTHGHTESGLRGQRAGES